MEVWKDIEGFEGKYQISNNGNIKSLYFNNTRKEQIIRQKINRGNAEVTLCKNNKKYRKMVSRLVFETFTGKKLSRNDIVRFRDKDKTNCSLDNLYLITRGEMQESLYDDGIRHRQEYEYYGQMLSVKEIAKLNNLRPDQIWNRMSKQYWNIYEASEIPFAVFKKGKGKI